MPLKSSKPLLMCDLDLSISKEVVKPQGKNKFRSKKRRIVRWKIKKREGLPLSFCPVSLIAKEAVYLVTVCFA